MSLFLIAFVSSDYVKRILKRHQLKKKRVYLQNENIDDNLSTIKQICYCMMQLNVVTFFDSIPPFFCQMCKNKRLVYGYNTQWSRLNGVKWHLCWMVWRTWAYFITNIQNVYTNESNYDAYDYTIIQLWLFLFQKSIQFNTSL